MCFHVLFSLHFSSSFMPWTSSPFTGRDLSGVAESTNSKLMFLLNYQRGFPSTYTSLWVFNWGNCRSKNVISSLKRTYFLVSSKQKQRKKGYYCIILFPPSVRDKYNRQISKVKKIKYSQRTDKRVYSSKFKPHYTLKITWKQPLENSRGKEISAVVICSIAFGKVSKLP